MSLRSPQRDALRLLFVLRAGGMPFADGVSDDIALIFKGEARLLAFDFWMRNPDYLAAELLDLFAMTKDVTYLQAAEDILDHDEPDLRRVPMIRYFFGAYERLDDALSILRSRDLIRITGVKTPTKVVETDFLLTKAGYEVCATALRQEPVLQWYADRAALVTRVAAGRGGAALKQQQYERATYAETRLGGVIPPIGEDVRQRLRKIQEKT